MAKTELTDSTRSHIRLGGFLVGVWCTQFVNSALHLVQPLLIANISGSLGESAFFSAFDTSVHMFGTFLGGWPVDRFGARRLLIGSTVLRGIALAGIPIFMANGILTLTWAMIWYTLDALVRGFVDASVHTLPLEMARHQTAELDRINSRYEFVFDLGGVLGPLMLGGIMVWFDGIAAHIVIPIGFLLSGIAFLAVPKSELESPRSRARVVGGGTWMGLKHIFSNRRLLLTCLGLMSFNIFPLRKLLASFFAKSILLNKAIAGPIGSAFALGGVIGALIYTQRKSATSSAFWISLGAVGTVILAVGWSPGSAMIMMVAAFLFALINVGARLALTRIRQELTPLTAAGGVTAASQFGANIVSVLIKALIGAAFTIGAGPRAAFAWAGLMLGAIAFGQFILGRSVARAGRRNFAEAQ